MDRFFWSPALTALFSFSGVALLYSISLFSSMAAISLITIFFAVVYAGLLIYYRFAWMGIPNSQFPIPNSTPVICHLSTVISVIIPARNEQQNISRCLDSLMRQSYPKELFEILVVDDHSEDDTAEIVKKYANQNVQLISLKDHVRDPINSYKKKAIEIAVAQAKGRLIVTTDADCLLSPDWLKTIAAFYEEKKPAFIAAPVSINCSNRFIEIFQSLDFMSLQGITGAVVSKKQMTMCNGANMAYERAAFYEVNGFAGIDHIASGDDMLLMHKIYQRYPERVLFLKSPDAIVQTNPVRSIKEFLNQRIRWAGKANKYDDKRILPVLLLVYLFNCLLIALPIISIFRPGRLSSVICHLPTFHLWLILLLVKTIFELFFLFPVAKFFNKRSLLWLFPLMQPFHIIYTVIAGWLGKFGNYKWKGRQVS